jgi:hypothetical protein
VTARLSQHPQLPRVAPSPDRSISAGPTAGFRRLVAAPRRSGKVIPSLLVACRPDLRPDVLLRPPAAELPATSGLKRNLVITTVIGVFELLGPANPVGLGWAVFATVLGLCSFRGARRSCAALGPTGFTCARNH